MFFSTKDEKEDNSTVNMYTWVLEKKGLHLINLIFIIQDESLHTHSLFVRIWSRQFLSFPHTFKCLLVIWQKYCMLKPQLIRLWGWHVCFVEIHIDWINSFVLYQCWFLRNVILNSLKILIFFSWYEFNKLVLLRRI